MKPFIKPAITALLFFYFLQAQAQSDSAQSKAQFKISVNYNTGLNYYGRTDSLKSSGFFPLAELWFTKDFYVNAAPVFVNNSVQSFDYAGTVASVGFQHVTDKWITSINFVKPFYKPNAVLVQSALKAQTGFNLSYLNKIVNINGGADLKFSDKTDFGATAGLDHIIKIKNADNSVIVFDPAVYVHAGTQQFQQSYYQKTSPGILFFPGTQSLVTNDVQKFNVLDYEISVPVVYAKGKWMFLATPSYIMPQNLVTIPNRPDLSERGENMFYATLTLKYSFPL